MRRLFILLGALGAVACLSDTLEPGAGPRVIVVTPEVVRLTVGDAVQLEVAVFDSAGVPLPDAEFSFSSRHPTIATVSATGRVAAVGPGTATILVESAGSAASVEIQTGLSFTAVAAGRQHTCAVTTTGALYCWGANDRGQLGVGDQADRLLPTRVAGEFSAVAAGDEHTCAIRTDEAAACWGRGTDGRLGTAGTTSESRPATVTGGIRFRAISAGGRHTCAIAEDPTAWWHAITWCWGANSDFQLGVGGFVSRFGPVEVNGRREFTTISAGEAHTCAVGPAADGWCWGSNAEGQLAIDSVITGPRTAERAAASIGFQVIRAGGSGFSCGLALDGIAWCWGRGLEHQLGQGMTIARQILPAAVVTSAGDTLVFRDLAAGWAHVCGLTPAGALWCWGTSRLGQPGLYVAPRPVLVLDGVEAVTAGFAHTCVLRTAGRLECWGGGQRGALGDGTTSSRDLPAPVALQLGDTPG